MQLDESELRGSIDGDEEIELALGGSNLGDVDMEIADRIGLELASRRGFAFDLRKPGDPVALQTAMEGRTRQMRDGWLQSVEAVVERQQGMPPESDDHSLLLDGHDRRPRLLRACRQIGDRGPRFPLGDGLRIDAVALGQRPQALLTMLYRSTDRLCRCGAPVKNLAHSASFESLDKDAPSKPGIKHLSSEAGNEGLTTAESKSVSASHVFSNN